MTKPSISELLLKNFSVPDKDEWLQIASSEIPQNSSLETLLWNVDGLTFSPYYIRDDLRGTDYLRQFHYRSNQLLSNSWLNMPDIRVINENEANEKALQFLKRGAEGILFDVSDLSDPNVDILLNNIQWDQHPVSFRTSDTKVATKILAFIEKKKYNLADIRGSILWCYRPETKQLLETANELFTHSGKFSVLGIEIPPSSPVQEISSTLQQNVQLVDEMTDLGLKRDTVFRSISLSVTCDENFLVNIAKLKTLRFLWYQLSQSFEISDYLPSELHLHCRTGILIDEKFQPHGNMIKNAVEVISSVLGGCNAITVIRDKSTDTMTDRVALNVSNILKAESHLDKVADPVAGSYALEKMVEEFSRAAWQDFQKLQS
jgi:methylmalonyl-CoA mutase